MSARGQKGEEESVQLSNTYNYKGHGGGLLIGKIFLTSETSSISSTISKQAFMQGAQSFEKQQISGKKPMNFNDTAPSSVL